MIKSRKKAVLAASVALLLLGGIGMCWFTLRLSRDITDVDRERSLRTAKLRSDWAIERVEFTAADGVPLVGCSIPVHEPKGTIVLSHGRGSGKGWFFRHGVVDFLLAEGYSVFAFDYRATGESGGNHCTLGIQEKLDLQAAVDVVRDRGEGPVIVWGVSMGAATAILAAADGLAVDLIVAESSYDGFRETVAHHQKLNYKLPKWPMTQLACWLTEKRTGCDTSEGSVVEAAAKVADTPLLLVHCTDDVRTPTVVMRRIYDAWGGGVTWYDVSDAGHGEAFGKGGEVYRDKLLSAFKSVSKQ